jgi:multidrug efflux pump subunit AcrB
VSISSFTIKNRVIVLAGAVLMSVWGAYTYMTIPQREDPEYLVRTCQVLTSWPGTETQKVEELITTPLEREINSLDGIRWVRSENTPGRSAIFVDLDRNTPGHEVLQMWDKVRARVDDVEMPDPSIVPVVNDEFGQTNVMLTAVHQIPLPGEDEIREENRYTYRQMEVFSERIADDLKLLKGVAKVERVGVRQEAIYIESDLGTWTQLELTTDQIRDVVSVRNVIAPGGTIDTGVGRVYGTPTGDLGAVDELNSVVLGLTEHRGVSTPVYLKDLDLTVIRDYQDPPLNIGRVGMPGFSEDAIILGFSMKGGSNIGTVCEEARGTFHRLREVDRILPPDVAITLITDASVTVERKINDFVWNVIGAILIVVVVVYLMVGFRIASVMASNIPLIVIGSIALIPLFDVQLEQISIAAMIIALGMLVDNAVQICDQSRRLQSDGMTPKEAAIEGANQISFPMLIATGTTVAAFYPMLLGLQGSTKEYVASLPITITIVLLLSWLAAMTFCTLMAFYFVRAPKDPKAPQSPVFQLLYLFWKPAPKTPEQEEKGGAFSMVARAAIKARFLVVGGAFAAMAWAISLPVGSEFFPQDLRDQFTIDVWLPDGASIEQTDEKCAEIEEIIRRLSPAKHPETGEQVERLAAMCSVIGQGAPRWYLGRNPEAPKPNFAEVVIGSTEPLFTPGFAEDIQRVALEGDEELDLKPVAGARIIVRQLMMGPSVDAPIGIRIFGTGFADIDIMMDQSNRLKRLFDQRDDTWDVYDTWGSPGYQMRVTVDEDAANLAGVSNASVAQTLNAYFSGHYLTTYREGDQTVPVYFRLPPEQRGSLDEIGNAYVEGLYGKVPLDQVADVHVKYDTARIDRRFLNRVIEVRARNVPGVRANDIVNDVINSEEFAEWERGLPAGYTWEVGGELFESKLSKADLQTSIMISFAAIVLLLIIQYNGVLKPIIVLMTIPMALIGAWPGLYFTNSPLGFMPQLGLLSLFGMVVNTAIIFIEFAERVIKERAQASDGSGPILGLTKEEFRECLVYAGKVRLLPISQTTLTTIGGLLPLALAGGPLWEGMAWLMIFGLTVSTVLTLIVVPCLYTIFTETFRMVPVSLEED